MDVTSLLNSSAAAAAAAAAARKNSGGSVDQTPTPSIIDGSTASSSALPTPSPERTPSRRTSESRTPNRSRTPWDAGGYSLPLALEDTKISQASSRPAFYPDSPDDSIDRSPKSPRHHASESRSSISSYTTSSSNSLSHSRISSLSTVSEYQPLSTIITDFSQTGEQCDSSIPTFNLPEAKDGSRKEVADSEGAPRRPGSPSDAMLMNRPGLRMDRISPIDNANPQDLNRALNFLVPPTDIHKTHKRAASAPDFPGINGLDQTFPPFGQTLEPTPPPSQQGERRTSYAMEPEADNTVADNSENSQDIICMYVENCDTGSQPRKAISHIFGRNKLCTRMIPSHVWVHFCRKHYQRSRYRNAQEYARLQCELVAKQVARVQKWSDENKRLGTSGVVQDWSLSIRKREQKRISDRSSAGRKRPFRDESEDEDDSLDRAVLNGTAVPQWLLEKCGNGYSTKQIEDVVSQLKQEMDEGHLTQIPDIEILPNIITDAAEEKAKTVLKRKTNTHKRSQSVGVALRPDSIAMTRRISQPGTWTAGFHSSPVEKRQRIADFGYFGQPLGVHNVAPPMPPMRHTYHLPHRPAFGNIRENQTEDGFFGERDMQNYSFGGPLPNPGGRRLSGQGMGLSLDATNASPVYQEPRRPTHQRSQSEIGHFQHNQSFAYRPAATQSYQQMPQNYAPTENMGYDPTYMRPDAPFQAAGPPSYYDEPVPQRPVPQMHAHSWNTLPTTSSPAMPAHRHVRHQSTPVVPQMFPRTSPIDQNSGSPFDYNRRDFDSIPHRQPSFRPTIEETDATRALYTERR